jgi:hypothetical protein
MKMNTKITCASLLCFLSLTSCNKLGTNYNIVFDNHFSLDQSNLMEEKILNWNAVNKEKISLSFSFEVNRAVCHAAYEPSGTICIHYSDEKTMLSMDSFPGTLQGLTHRNNVKDTSDIYLAMDKNSGELGHTIEHEVGHAMGLFHTTEGAMFWDSSSPECAYDVTPVDVNQYLYIRGLTDKKEFVFYH